MFAPKSYIPHLLRSVGISSIALTAIALPASARAQQIAHGPFSVAAMPLEQALRQIEARSGEKIVYDPDAVVGVSSRPVVRAGTASDAVTQALRGSRLSFEVKDGVIIVGNDIVVIARRDEAETSVLVRQASTSDRNGVALRDQPRNTQVISSKLLEQQQALTLNDALLNAGGVSTRPGVQSGQTFSVRGFASGGLVNGMGGGGGPATGSGTAIATIERVEVLKGPDALLAGFDNLGGNVNVVTKRPSADSLLTLTFDTGSYGLVRGTIDANRAVTKDGKLSARIIATGQTMDRNYGGYTGNTETLIAPSLRFKDGRTDLLLSFSNSVLRQGLTPFAIYNRQTDSLLDLDPYAPTISKDQSVRVESTKYYFDLSHKLFEGVTFVVKGLREDSAVDIDTYGLNIDQDNGIAYVNLVQARQTGRQNALDAFFRIDKTVGKLNVKLNFGYNYSDGFFESYNVPGDFAGSPDQFFFAVPTDQIGTVTNPGPLLAATERVARANTEQHGIYAQVLLNFGRFHLTGGVRHGWFKTSSIFFPDTVFPGQDAQATAPNFGGVFDVTDTISIFANYVDGVQATTETDFSGRGLPNTRTLNKEAGVKIDLFNKGVTINASYFDLLQDPALLADPAHPGFFIVGPGQRGRGIDINVSGTIRPGWIVTGSLTRADYSSLNPDVPIIAAQPRDTYSLYTSYERRITGKLTGGASIGLYGRSSSYGDFTGVDLYRIPEAHQVNVNAFLSFSGFNVNLGVRNVFNRLNYNTTSVLGYIPVDEPRNVRLTISKSFF